MPTRLTLRASLLAVLACAAWGQRPTAPLATEPSGAATEVLALEKKIEDAVVRGDVAFMDRVLASDFSFVHGDAWTAGGKPLASDNKAVFLKRVADKEYLVHDLDAVKTEVHGDSVITYGRYVSLYMPKTANAVPPRKPAAELDLVRASLCKTQRAMAVSFPSDRARTHRFPRGRGPNRRASNRWTLANHPTNACPPRIAPSLSTTRLPSRRIQF